MATKASRTTLARTVADRLLAAPEKRSLIMRELAAYLLEHAMTSEAGAVMNDVAAELFNRTGRLPVSVRAAKPLSEQSRAELIKYLQDETGARAVDLQETIDESLIGGLVARTPSAELDISISTRLKQLASLV